MPSISRLETLPRDVLRHIAYLSASGSPFDSPDAILSLLQTNATLYRGLSLYTAPDLYANIFSVKFDLSALSRRYREQLTDSALAGELVNRYRVLRRAQRVDFSPTGLLQDMWTALWMLLENDDLNERQLSAVNFADYLLGLVPTILGPQPSHALDSRTDSQYLKHIAVWLLCLSLRRRVIMNMPKQARNELYSAIFPFIFDSDKTSTSLSPESHLPRFSGLGCPSDQDRQVGGPPHTHDGHPCAPYGASCASSAQIVVSAYLKSSLPVVPDPSTAAINLACVINEAIPMQVPPHLVPEARAGMNMDALSPDALGDYRIPSFTSYRSLLLADCMHSDTEAVAASPTSSSRRAASALFDIQFYDTLQISASVVDTESFRYIPGTLSALWEGTVRGLIAPTASINDAAAARDTMDFTKPMQVHITEYICTWGEGHSTFAENGTFEQDSFIDSFDISGTKLFFGDRVYHKYQSTSALGHPGTAAQSKPLYDVILVGQTLEDHGHAWGGFTFTGRVHKNGSIVLKREAKDASTQQSDGVWIFVGRMQSPAMILGRWRTSGAPETGPAAKHGVFSLGRARQ